MSFWDKQEKISKYVGGIRQFFPLAKEQLDIKKAPREFAEDEFTDVDRLLFGYILQSNKNFE